MVTKSIIIPKCSKCQYFKCDRVYTADSFETAFDWICGFKNQDKKIAGYVGVFDKDPGIPDWCPLVELEENIMLSKIKSQIYKNVKENNMKVYLADITTISADAIVNAANRSLLGGGGVDGAIHKAAGPGLLAECQTLNGCETGKAKITDGYKLPAKHVIHAVGPIWREDDQENCESLLARCYENCLDLAIENNCKNIVFPCISTGAYGFPRQKAAEIAIDICREYAEDIEVTNKTCLKEIIFCCFLKEDYEIYEELLNTIPPKQYGFYASSDGDVEIFHVEDQIDKITLCTTHYEAIAQRIVDDFNSRPLDNIKFIHH